MSATSTTGKLRVFISYSRRDAASADSLVEALLARGFEITIDRRDLPFGEKWQAELTDFIRLSDSVVWLVSDASIQSKWVNWELDEVARRNKRLVPVMITETARDALPRQLGEIHILPSEGVFNPRRDLDQLVHVLETDRGWLKQASRLQDRAHEWLSKSRTSALLLSRGALSEAERWKDRRPAKAPAPAQEVLDLILASRHLVTRRQRWWLGGSLFAAAGAMVLAGIAYRQSLEADRQRAVAVDQQRIAERERTNAIQSRDVALAAQSQSLATFATTENRNGDHTTAALLALVSLGIGENPEAEQALYSALLSNRELMVTSVSGNPDDRPNAFRGACHNAANSRHDLAAAICPPEATVSVSSTGQLLWKTSNSSRIEPGAPGGDYINGGSFSMDGQWLALGLGSTDVRELRWPGSVSLRESRTGKEIKRFHGSDSAVAGAAISDDGKLVAAASLDGSILVWDVKYDKLVARLTKKGLFNQPYDRPIDDDYADWKADASYRFIYPEPSYKSFWTMDAIARTTWSFSPSPIEGSGQFSRFARCEYFDRPQNFGWNSVALTEQPTSDALKFELTKAGDVAVIGKGRELILTGHRGTPFCAFAIPTRQELVTFSAAFIGATNVRNWVGEIRVYDASDGRHKATLEGHLPPEELWFAHDMQRALTVGGARILWRTSTWMRLTSTYGQKGESAASQVFSSTSELISFARSRMARCLTRAQRARYGLSAMPPSWCVGRGLWPYHGADWKHWLAQYSAWLASGRQGAEPRLPTDSEN